MMELDRLEGRRTAMDVISYGRSNEKDERDLRGLFAHEMLRHDVYGFPDEDVFVFCPECGGMAENFDLIEHEGWCFYGGMSICSEKHGPGGTRRSRAR
jgi:hypothetical protein